MSLFEKIKSRKINLTEQSFTDKQRSDMKKLLNKNFGTKEISKKTADTQKNLSKANKEVFNVTGKSAVRDAKKYASGEYPKIGGGERMSPKSKGSGAETGAKPIKQSEVSKKAKVFTKKIEKNQIVKAIKKDADRLVRKAEKGDKKARKKIFKVLDKRFKKLSPADQEIQAKKMYDVQKKMGRTFNPKTGNFEGPDTEFQKSISKIKDSKGKRITSGPVSVTAGPEIRKRVEKIRDTRATKAGMPDPFKSTTKAQTKFDDIFKGVKKTKKFKLGGKTQFDISKTPVGKMELPPKKVSPEVQKKTFDAFKTKISDATKKTVSQDKKFRNLKKNIAKLGLKKLPKTPSQPETGFGGKPGSQPVGGTSGSSTRTVKQSEVSKQAKEFTKKINAKKIKNIKVKGDPLVGNFDYDEPVKKSTPKSTPKPTLKPTPKPTPKPKSTPKPKTTNVFKTVSKVTSGKKVTNSKGIGNKFRGAENKAAKNAEIKKRGGSVTGGGGKPPKNNKPLSSPAPEPNNNSSKIVKQSKYDKIKADIDARNPTKPGQYTGKPVPLKQKEYTSFKNKNLSTKGKKFVEGLPKFLKNKNFAKIGKAALKNPYVAAGAAVVGTALAGYGAYRGIKGLLNKPKAASLKTTDLKPGRTVTYGRDDPKGKFKKGDDVRFDALGLGFTKKKGVEKKKPTFQDFQSGKYQYTSK